MFWVRGACCTVYLGKTIVIQATCGAVLKPDCAYPPAETNSSPLTVDGWNIQFPLGAFGLFSKGNPVTVRESSTSFQTLLNLGPNG